VHIAAVSEVYPLVAQVPANAELLMKQFWPGPLTLVFKHSNNVPKETVAGLDTIESVYLNTVAWNYQQSQRPIAASANLSGKPNHRPACIEDLNGRLNAIIDGALTQAQNHSIDLSCDPRCC
jgi:L-threonylcarbamoyladenylate synthase